MASDARVAELLERAAIEVESSPGTNVLDAIRSSSTVLPEDERDRMLADTFFALLDYLPPHVDSLARWSDNETSERAAGKLRQLARTMRNGGPREVEALPAMPSSAETQLVDEAGSRNHPKKHNRRPEHEWSVESQLRQERGRLLSALTRMRRAKHPNAHEITEKELRVVEVERELAQIEADAKAQELIDESQSFPPERRPGLESGLLVGRVVVA